MPLSGRASAPLAVLFLAYLTAIPLLSGCAEEERGGDPHPRWHARGHGDRHRHASGELPVGV